MKRNTRGLAFIVGAAMLLLAGGLFFWIGGNNAGESTSSAEGRPDQRDKQRGAGTPKRSPASFAPIPLPPAPPGVDPEEWRRSLERQAIAQESNKNVSFYGRIVDQNGLPIEGVHAAGFILSRPNLADSLATGSSQNSEEFFRVSGKDGTFSIKGETGYSLSFTS